MKSYLFAICLMLGASVFSGCLNVGAPASPDNAAFYVLSSQNAPSGNSLLSGTTVHLRQVTLPGYLETNKIAIRNGSQIEYVLLDQWSEPLNQSVTRVIGEVIQQVAMPAQLSVWPEPRNRDARYILQVNFRRMEGQADGRIAVVGTWQLIESKDHTLIRSGSFSETNERYTPGDYAALVQALNQALTRVSSSIVSQL